MYLHGTSIKTQTTALKALCKSLLHEGFGIVLGVAGQTRKHGCADASIFFARHGAPRQDIDDPAPIDLHLGPVEGGRAKAIVTTGLVANELGFVTGDLLYLWDDVINHGFRLIGQGLGVGCRSHQNQNGDEQSFHERFLVLVTPVPSERCVGCA